MEEEKTHDSKQDLLHSDIHKILMQGLIAHMDFNDVYDRVHTESSKNNKREGKLLS